MSVNLLLTKSKCICLKPLPLYVQYYVVVSVIIMNCNIVAGGTGNALVSEDGIKSGGSSGSTNSSKGSDINSNGQFSIDGQRLYNIANHDSYGNHYIVLDVKGKGFQAYTFTFG